MYLNCYTCKLHKSNTYQCLCQRPYFILNNLNYIWRVVMHLFINVIGQGEKKMDPIFRSKNHKNVRSSNVLKGFPDSCIAKQVYNELCPMNYCDFINWVKHAWQLVRTFGLHNYLGDATEFKAICKSQLMWSLQNNWLVERSDHNINPKLRTYSLFETTFGLEPYLTIVKDPRYRNAITRLHSNSHNLEMERGRQYRPKVPPQKRLCHVCRTLEDEKKFLITCEM